jgi:glycosyltransferase involved in cell wall biosynthesis
MNEKSDHNIPKVAVIVPVYNTEDYLRECIMSVEQQDYPELQIVIVDDGSDDHSPEICNELEMRFNNIMVLHKKNGGLSSARNEGLGVVSEETKYILFLDSDDKLVGGVIHRMVELAERENAEIVYSDRFILFFEKNGYTKEMMLFLDEGSTDPSVFCMDTLIGQGRGARATGVLYKRESIVKNHVLFPERRVSEDFFFNLKLLSKIERLAIYHDNSLICTRRGDSISQRYHESFCETLFIINADVEAYLEESGNWDETNVRKVQTLLCRNITYQIWRIMSRHNKMNYDNKVKKCEEMLNRREAIEAFQNVREAPWQTTWVKRYGMMILFMLIRSGHRRFAYRLLYFI